MSIKIKLKKPKFVIKVKSTDVVEEKQPVDELEALEKQLEQMQKEKLAKKNKKKMQQEVLSPSTQMRLLHAPWVKEVGNNYSDEYKVNIQSDIDRIDICSKKEDQNWRLCIVGLHNKQVDVSLFLEGKPDFMNPQISFLHMPEERVIYIIDYVLDMRLKKEFTI